MMAEGANEEVYQRLAEAGADCEQDISELAQKALGLDVEVTDPNLDSKIEEWFPDPGASNG